MNGGACEGEATMHSPDYEVRYRFVPEEVVSTLADLCLQAVVARIASDELPVTTARHDRTSARNRRIIGRRFDTYLKFLEHPAEPGLPAAVRAICDEARGNFERMAQERGIDPQTYCNFREVFSVMGEEGLRVYVCSRLGDSRGLREIIDFL